MFIFLILYLALGYWATGKTYYRNSILFGDPMEIFVKRVVVGCVLGWILIPIAIIGKLLGK